MNIQQFLTEHAVEYEALPHGEQFSASHLADALHTPGDSIAKTVVLKADGRFVLAVLPASHHLEMGRARSEMGCRRLEMAHEDEFGRLFPDCDPGAIPPFGSFYGVETWVDSHLAEDDHIVFDAQSDDEALRMSYASYESVEDPLVASLSRHA